MKKRILSILLCTVLLLSCFPVSTGAATTTTVTGVITDSYLYDYQGGSVLKTVGLTVNGTETTYYEGTSNATDYLGYEVTATISGSTILSVTPTDRNFVVTLSAEQLYDISYYSSYMLIHYTGENSDLTLKLSNKAEVYSNYSSIGTFDIFSYGTVTFISNDLNDTFDYAIITEHETEFLVGYIDSSTQTIYSPNLSKSIALTPSSGIVYQYFKDGEPASFSDISVYDIVTIAGDPTSSPGVVSVFISTTRYEGRITRISGDNYTLSTTTGESILCTLSPLCYIEPYFGTYGVFFMNDNHEISAFIESDFTAPIPTPFPIDDQKKYLFIVTGVGTYRFNNESGHYIDGFQRGEEVEYYIQTLLEPYSGPDPITIQQGDVLQLKVSESGYVSSCEILYSHSMKTLPPCYNSFYNENGDFEEYFFVKHERRSSEFTPTIVTAFGETMSEAPSVPFNLPVFKTHSCYEGGRIRIYSDTRITIPSSSYHYRMFYRKNGILYDIVVISPETLLGDVAPQTLQATMTKNGSQVTLNITANDVPENANVYAAIYNSSNQFLTFRPISFIDGAAQETFSVTGADHLKLFTWSSDGKLTPLSETSFFFVPTE